MTSLSYFPVGFTFFLPKSRFKTAIIDGFCYSPVNVHAHSHTLLHTLTHSHLWVHTSIHACTLPHVLAEERERGRERGV